MKRIEAIGKRIKLGTLAVLVVSLAVSAYIMFQARVAWEHYLSVILYQFLLMFSVWFGLATGLVGALAAVLVFGSSFFFWSFAGGVRGDIGFEEAVWFFIIPLGAAVAGYVGDILNFVSRLFVKYDRQIESLLMTQQLGIMGDEAYFAQAVQEECSRARRSLSTFAVLILDIMNLDDIQKLLGADAPTQTADKISEIICRSTRDIDKKARLDGTPIGLMLVDCSPQAAGNALARIRENLKQIEVDYRGRTIPVTVKLAAGMVFFPEHGDTPEKLISAAKEKLQEAQPGSLPTKDHPSP